MGNFSIIELLMIAAAIYMGVAKNSAVTNKWAIYIVGAVLLLLLFLSPGADQTSPLQGFNLSIGNFNFMFLGAVAVLLYFIWRKSEAGESVRGYWLGLAGVFFLSAGGSPININF